MYSNVTAFIFECNKAVTSIQLQHIIQPIQYIIKKVKATPTEVIMRKGKMNCHPFLLKAEKDATIPFESSLPITVIGTILPFLPPYNLYIFIMSINICQVNLTHELVVNIVVNFLILITKNMLITSQLSIHFIQYFSYHYQNNSCSISNETFKFS